ncbi:hypothetical protein [Aquincola tertiaricarbonis]|uniref:hypothetical protein n=1 Tax=Aquincola tertiaricarbonis TaxID=391953 RepID=UPI0018DBC952|nr:hypothetical protein [Aquincola tertiaricarbonis]
MKSDICPLAGRRHRHAGSIRRPIDRVHIQMWRLRHAESLWLEMVWKASIRLANLNATIHESKAGVMYIYQQVELLQKITQVMSQSAEFDYEEMTCEFDYYIEDGDWSVGSTFSFVRGGRLCQSVLEDPARDVSRLVRRLHDLMLDHTGGNWKTFEIVVDRSGKAKTHFGY